ncbi:MAG: bifunctional methylenetetrahydrofolate dehydrogenase/methenyltetrahydrofolate cyclohydrolase FolD [Kiloniellaceae bacterium]
MTADAKIIDGAAFAKRLRARVAEATAKIKTAHGLVPGIAVVLVGDNPASQVYVRNKSRAVGAAGMVPFDKRLGAETGEAELLALVRGLNADERVHGILVQLPLPERIDARAVIDAIDPAKDVDGFHVVNAGRLATGGEGLVPCTPLGCLMLLKSELGDLSGRRAVVVGRSNIVGKPMVQLLLKENCTVTVAHSRTRDLPGVCREADILVAAVGRPRMVKGDWIKPGATVIDVGINPIEGKGGKTRLVGDVATEEAVKVAGAITPVPGGVGPMTIACLLANTAIAACRQKGLAVPAF